MAILRGVGIQCRLHGFTIDKLLQKGAFTGIWYKLAPQNILHTWVEVKHNQQWFNLEGVILDKKYLPSKPIIYTSKAKSAQEAHEAIRPTDAALTPDSIKKNLTDDQYKL